MPLREHAVTLAYTVAGLVCVLAMQRHALADVGGAVTRGWEASSTPDHRRRLAGASTWLLTGKGGRWKRGR